MGMLRLPEPYRGLPRSIYVLFFANIVNSLGNFVWPFLTLYLTERLGMNKAAAGGLVTLSALAYVPGSLFGGKLADHLGRKRVFLISRLLGALALVPCAFLGVSPVIPWLLIATNLLSAAVDPSLSAMVADLTNRQTRQGAFSLLYLGHNLGFAVGPILAGFLYRSHLPWLFLGDALTTVLSIALVAVYVRETLPGRASAPEAGDEEEVPEQERAEEGGLLAALGRRPAVLLFSVALMVYSFVYVQHGFSLPLQMRSLFPVKGPSLYGVLMSVNAVTVVLCTTLLTRLTRRLDSTLNIVLGGLCYAAGFGMIALVRTVPPLVLSTVIWTFGEIMVVTNSSVYLANHAPISHRGRFRAVMDVVSGTGWALGPLLMGRVIDRTGVQVVWPFAFYLGLGGSLLMLALWGAERLRAAARRAEPEVSG